MFPRGINTAWTSSGRFGFRKAPRRKSPDSRRRRGDANHPCFSPARPGCRLGRFDLSEFLSCWRVRNPALIRKSIPASLTECRLRDIRRGCLGVGVVRPFRSSYTVESAPHPFPLTFQLFKLSNEKVKSVSRPREREFPKHDIIIPIIVSTSYCRLYRISAQPFCFDLIPVSEGPHRIYPHDSISWHLQPVIGTLPIDSRFKNDQSSKILWNRKAHRPRSQDWIDRCSSPNEHSDQNSGRSNNDYLLGSHI